MDTNESFSILARTCTLKYNSQEGNSTIFGNQNKYVIPIYQRPYSWKEEQIRKFLSDIFLGYWGSDCVVVKEPMFIGTMQLAKKNSKTNKQDVIDGQQRLTTFIILFKVLKLKKCLSKELDLIQLDWLETNVNNKTQQKDLDQFLGLYSIEENEDIQNKYIENARLVLNILKEIEEINYDDFINYILSKVYFVVIETHATLSKTLQIFNAINTTGLDLNGEDIFKLKMYEYLCDKNSNVSEEEKNNYFLQISFLYEKIVIRNKENNLSNNISGSLDVYKYVLVSKYDLPKTLYFYETNRFFEELFDTLLNTNNWQNFKSIKEKKLELSIDDLEKIIDSRFQWDLIYKSHKTSALLLCTWHFIWWSRYSRYHILIYLFIYKFSNDFDFDSKLLLFNSQISKLFIIYSIRYQKLKSEVYYSFMYEVLDFLINKTFIELIKLINDKIGTVENHKYEYDIEDILNGDIVYNAKLKNIVCRLSAMLEEDYNSNNKEICQNLFYNNLIDIEHIQSFNDAELIQRDEIWKTWGSDINSIGNLMVLEFDINRSISNNSYYVKILNGQKTSYNKSKFKIVKNQVQNFNNGWNHTDCIKRKDYEVKKILNYLFDKN